MLKIKRYRELLCWTFDAFYST